MKYLKLFEKYNNYEDIKSKLSTIHIDDLTEEDIAHYVNMRGHNGFTEETDKQMVERIWYHIKDIQKLKDSMVLYRVLDINDVEKINKDKPGIHYVLDVDVITGVFLYDIGIYNNTDPNLHLLTVSVDKYNIDIISMLDTNMDYQHEQEITLKSDYSGVEVIKVEKFED